MIAANILGDHFIARVVWLRKPTLERWAGGAGVLSLTTNLAGLKKCSEHNAVD